MNCISSLKTSALLLLSLASCSACGSPAATGSAAPDDPLRYRIEYDVSAVRGEHSIRVTMRVSQATALLRELRIHADQRVSAITADGELAVGDEEVRWRPPATGGTLSWQVDVTQRRNGDGHDAWLGTDWGIFRAEDIVPRAATRTLKGARSETYLRFRLPRSWSVVTEYKESGGRFRIDKPERRFDQPSGWILVGKLGVRREEIAGVHVAVAGPVGQSVRRMDTLALLRWTLPELARVLPDLPGRLTIVSAGEPMWRGGLSAPQSLFVHAERPLISENGTSTLLHEIMHVVLGLATSEGYDWIVEGLAEYYSLELLHRSGTISTSRLATAKADLADWATSATDLCRPASTGATTALAVGVFTRLDEEIRRKSDGSTSLDNVVRELARGDTAVDADRLIEIVHGLLGAKPGTLHVDKLPGCRTIAADTQET